MTVRVYRSSDAGAPNLSIAGDGSFFSILKACLVTGYGSRTAAGWTVVFEDSGKGAFKMSAGSERILAVDDTLDDSYAEVFACDTFTDFSTYTKRFPISPDGYNLIWYKRVDTGSDASDWTVIASESFVYFFNEGDGSNRYLAGEFFGDYECVSPTFTNNTCMTGRFTSNPSSSPASYIQNSLFQYSSVDHRFLRTSWTNVFEELVIFDNIDDQGSRTQGHGVNPLSGKLDLTDYAIHARGVYMGKLPNTYLLKYPKFNNDLTTLPPSVTEIDGVNTPSGNPMISVCSKDTNRNLLIEVDVL